MGTARWGILGAAAIADGAVIPTIQDSAEGSVTAIASRSGDRARAVADAHGIPAALDSYEELLVRDDIDHVYVALPNSLHCQWAVKAAQAGKNVLCEKPLATAAQEGRQIAAAAAASNVLVMEAFMYRFNERTKAFVESAPAARHVNAVFAYPQADPQNIRLSRELGGGALADLGCYTVDVVRWLLGEPEEVEAGANVDGVDRSVAAVLTFGGGSLATLWASFETPELQEVTVLGNDCVRRTTHRPFGGWFDPLEPDRLGPYRRMVAAFATAAEGRTTAPVTLEDSIANLEVMDRIRAAAGIARSADAQRQTA
jgi:xylose dehydrogenase (NAD/NADP)